MLNEHFLFGPGNQVQRENVRIPRILLPRLAKEQGVGIQPFELVVEAGLQWHRRPASTVSYRAPGCHISTTALVFAKKSIDGPLAAAASNGRYDYGTDDVMNSSTTS